MSQQDAPLGPQRSTRTRWHRISFLLLGAMLLLIIASLPFALTSVLGYVIRPQSSHIYALVDPSVSPASNHARLHVDVVSLDEWNRTLQMRVAGSHVCLTPCTQTDQLTFVASPESGDLAEGLPPSESVQFPPTGTRVTQTITLPVVGQPILFPFDTYRLGLGVIFESIDPSGAVQMLDSQSSAGHLFLTMQTHVVRSSMSIPASANADSLGLGAPGEVYAGSWVVIFSRPAYLQVLTILLVLLVIVAAIYAVLLRPLAELVINAGALVLGIWGIRSILLGSSPPGATLVDLALTMVIMFLLLAIVGRALWYHRRQGEVRFRREKPTPPTDAS